MQYVSNEKNKKNSKYFIFLVTMAIKVGGVDRYEKNLFSILNYYSHSPSVYRDIYR